MQANKREKGNQKRAFTKPLISWEEGVRGNSNLTALQFAVKTAKRLSSIEIKANNILVGKYQLTYQEEGQPIQSILTSVQQIGYDANGQNPAGLPAITLTYKDDDDNTLTRSDLPAQIGNMTWEKDNYLHIF